jgi:hypothetical protein
MYHTRRILTLVASVAVATLFSAGLQGALAGGRGAQAIFRAGPPATAQLGIRASQPTSQSRVRGNTKWGDIEFKRGVDISKQLW